MKQPKPRAHGTVESPSDHDWYWVRYELPNGADLTIGTANLSIAAVKRRPERLQNALRRFAARCDVVVIQEAGAGREIVQHAAQQAGCLVWFGQGRDGQSSTPLIVQRGLAARFNAHPLLGRRRLDPRAAGPSRSKPKWLMCVTLNVPAVHAPTEVVTVAGVHATPSTRFKLNKIAAGILFERARNRLLKMPGWAFLAGDLNQPYWSRVLDVLRRRRFRSSQRALGAIDTGPHRSPIDDVWHEISRKR